MTIQLAQDVLSRLQSYEGHQLLTLVIEHPLEELPIPEEHHCTRNPRLAILFPRGSEEELGQSRVKLQLGT